MWIKSKIIAITWVFKKIGYINATKIFFEILIKKPKEHLVKFKFKNKNIQIFIMSLRTDLAMLTEVFCFESYEIKKNITPKLIIDGGANKGSASIYFGIKYQNAKIHCYEPNKNLINILERNLRLNCINAEVYEAALSDKDGVMFFNQDKNHQYSKLTKKDTGIKVKTISLNTKYNNQKIDILKLDVEGSEEEIIKSLDSSLHIDIIIQEIHYNIVNFDNILFMLKMRNYYVEKPYIQYRYLNPTKRYPIILALENKKNIY